MKQRIHVNRHHIAANKKGAKLPVFTAQSYKDRIRGNEIKLLDKGRVIARFVYRPDKPLSCGATAWLETECEVRAGA